METIYKLDVYYENRLVGIMAPYQRFMTAFEYSPVWLADGFSINPFSLPLEPGVKISKADPFDGLFGIFADSLPDGWGRLLVDRMLRKKGEDPFLIDPLQRLSIVGDSGMGALEYRPAFVLPTETVSTDYDHLAGECKKLLESKEPDDLDSLFAMGGSSGGARPKIMVKLDGEEWIVKFPSSTDSDEIGMMEYDYARCAEECGIVIPEVRLFESKVCAGYFGCKRFDRNDSEKGMQKVHMASASALLEVSHRVPALDYSSLMALTWQLTKKAAEMERMYTLMCFNVFAHNRDDHSNNFTFLYDDRSWHLSPAYDLTYSNSIGGQHATTIAGEGIDPQMEDLLQVAKKAGIKNSTAKQIAEKVHEIVNARLSKYLFKKK